MDEETGLIADKKVRLAFYQSSLLYIFFFVM